MTRRLNSWLLIALFIVGVPYYWYLLDSGPRDVPAKPLTMEYLREMAGTIEGQPPTEVRVELIGHLEIMRNALVAGWGLRPVRTAVRSYQLIVPGEAPIVIDAGTTRTAARDLGMTNFNEAAQRRVTTAVEKAGHVVILLDEALHNGGRKRGGDDGAKAFNPAPYALAPGVVVVPTDGLGRGAQMVYARLENGREFLFTGPAAKIGESLRSLDPPARIGAAGESPVYLPESKAWLTTINALQRAAPHMTVVTGHDFAQVPHAIERFSD